MYGISVLCSSRFRPCNVRYYSSNGTKKLLEFLAKMPKVNTARISEAQRQRQNISRKSEKYAPSTVYLQVLGSGARGAPNTLYLFTDQKRYLFNCGECTQRLAHEHKVKLSRLDHIFITSKSWRNIGGLPGLSLTLQDVGVPNITLHGPEGLDELYNATRRFVIMKDMNVTMAKCTPNEDFEDNTMSVKYVLLGPHDHLLDHEKPAAKRPRIEHSDKEFEEFVHDDTDYYHSEHHSESRPKIVRDRSKSRARDKETDKEKITKKSEKVLQYLQKKSNCTVAYICTLKKRLGTLDLAKCVELGVKPGPMLGQLKNGKDLVLPDGSIVFSKQVKTPDDPGPVFIVMEVPDISYLKESEFSTHFDNNQNPPENIPTLIVHCTPPHVFNHPTYRAFMTLFGQSCRHLVLNAQNSCLGSEAVHRTQHKLHLLDSDIFPLLKDASVPAVWNSSPPPNNDSPTRRGLEDLKNKIALAQFQNIITMEGSRGDGQSCGAEGDESKLDVLAARTLTMFHLRPKRQVDRSAEPKLHIQDYIQETMDMDGFVGSLEQFRRLVDNMRYARTDTQKEYPKVLFLGTGSCIPSKTRNTSAIVLQIDENRSMLMDCGEGTFGQLVRFYGSKKVNAFLRTLKAIYVSHLHADHHIGLIGVLQARREAFEQARQPCEPVALLAPGQIFTWLSLYDQQFERIKPDFKLIPNQSLLEEPTQPAGELSPAVLASIGVQHIVTCQVSHCPNAFGLAIHIDDTNKLTYSGDTIPCEALAYIGKDTTLLIHEATMEDELADEARTKMHSTTTQAIEMGRHMNAKYTVLTHFSQRYARLPRLNANILNDNKTVGIAFDNMQISMSDLELLPHMYAPLQLMFAEHCVEMEMKAAHRARQKEREEKKKRAADTQNMPPEKNTSPSASRRRRVSPGCRVTSSGPVPWCEYRESNSSRLRQEIKGMTVIGVVKKGSRSTSSSPVNGRSARPSPTRSLNSDSGGAVSPRRRNSERTINLIAAARTMSETSQGSSRDSHERNKVTSNAPSGFLVDTHTTNSSGYGKPLVTPVNKKLTIRRENHPEANMVNTPKLCRSKSNVKTTCKVIHKAPFNTSARCPIIMKPYELLSIPIVQRVIPSVLIHLIVWRFAHIASCVFFKAWPCAIVIIALAIVFWTATKETISRNSLRSSAAAPTVKREEKTYGVKSKGIVNMQKLTTTTIEANKSPIRQNRSADSKPQDMKSPANRNKVKQKFKSDPQYANPVPGQVPHVATTKTSVTKIPKRIYSENSMNQNIKGTTTLRNNSTEKLKQQFCRDTPVYAAGRPNSMIHSSSKSFKPQLEDIQSSYLLLNEQQKEYDNSLKAGTENANVIVTPKPKKLNEYDRKVQLIEARKKFQSRAFMNESRYEKIEGLNWISWN